MNFYKSVIEHHGKLLVRGIHNGQDFKEKIDYSPTLYAISQENTEFKTLQDVLSHITIVVPKKYKPSIITLFLVIINLLS